MLGAIQHHSTDGGDCSTDGGEYSSVQDWFQSLGPFYYLLSQDLAGSYPLSGRPWDTQILRLWGFGLLPPECNLRTIAEKAKACSGGSLIQDGAP